MKKLKEDAVPANATGTGVSGFSPRLLGVVKRAMLERKKKKRNGRKK